MKRLLVATATCVVLAWVTPARATPITYTEQLTGTGTIGGSTFTNALVTINLFGDTSTVSGSPGSFERDFGTATVTVFGFGTATFTDPQLWAFDNPFGGSGSTPVAGISDITASLLIADTNNVAFATYDLRTSIGPLAGPVAINPGALFPTTMGNFALTSVSGNTSTFSATTSAAVPEPATLTLITLGLTGLVTRYRRRSSRSTSQRLNDL
jgi:hypothetical protein